MKRASIQFITAMLFSLLIVAPIFGCNFEHLKTASGQEALNENPGYEDIRSKILVPYCLSCHMSRSPQLTSYEAVVANIKDIEDQVLVRHTMPKGGKLPENLQTLLRTWIDNGTPREGSIAANPTPTPSPTVIPVGSIPRPFTYADLKERVLTQKCFLCHVTGNPDENPVLDKYESFVQYAPYLEGAVIGVNGSETTPENKRMPPKAANQLTQEEKAYFLLWLNDGKLEQ